MAIRFAGYGGLFSAVGSRFFDVLFGVEALRGGLLSAKSCLLEPAEIDPKQSSLTIELTGLHSRSGRSGGMMVSPKICTCLSFSWG